MTLSFTEKINNKPNYFVEKIWHGLILNRIFGLQYYDAYQGTHYAKFGRKWEKNNENLKTRVHPKVTTIREDKGNRWKVGMAIHPVINNRSENRYQFAPTFRCLGLQAIEIKMSPCDLNGVNASETKTEMYIDGRLMFSNYWYFQDPDAGFKMLEFVRNDGFESVPAFLKYFNKPFKGKIIHWTNLKY